MRLFKLTKDLPANWFVDTHKAITDAETVGELDLIKAGIEQNLSSFYVSNSDKAKLMMALAWCNLRTQFVKNELKRNTHRVKY